MYCVKNIKDDLFWVGGSDRRLALFENAYPIPNGISYNSYLLLDEKTVLFDTVDRAITGQFFENVESVLAGRTLDYVIINHMEPDHCATRRTDQTISGCLRGLQRKDDSDHQAVL